MLACEVLDHIRFHGACKDEGGSVLFILVLPYRVLQTKLLAVVALRAGSAHGHEALPVWRDAVLACAGAKGATDNGGYYVDDDGGDSDGREK